MSINDLSRNKIDDQAVVALTNAGVKVEHALRLTGVLRDAKVFVHPFGAKSVGEEGARPRPVRVGPAALLRSFVGSEQSSSSMILRASGFFFVCNRVRPAVLTSQPAGSETRCGEQESDVRIRPFR